MNMLKCEKLSEEFVHLLGSHTNLIPKVATSVFEKAVIDADNQMSPRCYNKLITRIKQDNDLMKGFLEKLIELTFNLFSALFSNPTNITATSTVVSLSSSVNAMFVNKTDTPDTLSHKSHGVLKFIGELFKTGVITCSDMKIFVDRLISK